jgi:hypothetical protein
MTTPQITPSQARFGQVLAFAERTLTEVLHQHLADRHVAPATWYALKLIVTGGPRLPRSTLTRDLERSRTLTADSARDAVTTLERDGLIHGDAEIELTAAGDAFYRDLRDYVSEPTARLLGQFDAADIDTTVRTLEAITRTAAVDG